MILDKYISFDQKVYISIIFASLWIYLRDLGCYRLLPRRSLFAVVIVAVWTYANYYEPLFLPIGLIIMYTYNVLNRNKEFTL